MAELDLEDGDALQEWRLRRRIALSDAPRPPRVAWLAPLYGIVVFFVLPLVFRPPHSAAAFLSYCWLPAIMAVASYVYVGFWFVHRRRPARPTGNRSKDLTPSSFLGILMIIFVAPFAAVEGRDGNLAATALTFVPIVLLGVIYWFELARGLRASEPPGTHAPQLGRIIRR